MIRNKSIARMRGKQTKEMRTSVDEHYSQLTDGNSLSKHVVDSKSGNTTINNKSAKINLFKVDFGY